METNQTAEIIFSVLLLDCCSLCQKRRTGGECQTSSDSAVNPAKRKNLFSSPEF